jgi:hypothetical protein
LTYTTVIGVVYVALTVHAALSAASARFNLADGWGGFVRARCAEGHRYGGLRPPIFVDTSFWAALRNRRDDRHRPAADAARNFVESLGRSSRTRIVFVRQEIEDEARRWPLRHDERPYSFVDATSVP